MDQGQHDFASAGNLALFLNELICHKTSPSKPVLVALATPRWLPLWSQSYQISTVEHDVCVVWLGIDNVTIEVDGKELPIMDGGALAVFLLQSAGIVDQSAKRGFANIETC